MTDTDMPWHWWLPAIGFPIIIVALLAALAFDFIRNKWLAAGVTLAVALLCLAITMWQIPLSQQKWDRDEARQRRLNECVWGGGVPIYRYHYKGGRTYVRCAAPFNPEGP